MDSPDVVIVGLGPVGAVFAALCATSGLNVRVIERDRHVYKQPRAIVMDHEVLRQINFIGCADRVLDTSHPAKGYEFLNQDREVLSYRERPPHDAPTRYPFANLFHQPSMEHAARDRLAEMPNVAITLGCEFIAIEQDDAGVTCIVKHDGKLETIHSKFAVGCDGGRSLTRRYLDIQLEDLGFDEPWVVVDVKVPEGYAGLSENGIQMCDPDRPTTCVPSGPGRHRWEFMLKPGETAEQVLRPESLRAWISTWINPDDVELERSAVYNFHGLVAKQWRKGRVMIIGDAAHQTPPFMGQGMCAGLRDAANLAWKLAMVHRGDAPDTLLDSLERERRPHAKAVIQGAIDMGKIVCVLDPAKAAARDRKMIADREAGKPFVLPDVPQIENGVLPDEIGGKVLPEGLTGDPGAPTRIDDICGYVPLLILKNAASSTSPFVHDMLSSTPLLRIAALNGTAEGCIPILDPDNIMSEMLGSDQAMLAKPDRIVFGKGGLQMLADKWQAYLTGTSFDSSQTVDAA